MKIKKQISLNLSYINNLQMLPKIPQNTDFENIDSFYYFQNLIPGYIY